MLPGYITKKYWGVPVHIVRFGGRQIVNILPSIVLMIAVSLFFHCIVQRDNLVYGKARAEADDPNPEVKIGLASIADGKVVWADFNQKDDQYFGAPFWRPDGSGILVQWMPREQK